jgi:pimeloyl-ACP methyl ester carboxylesterase
MPTTYTLSLVDADIVYDVRGPRPTRGGRPALFMIGQPMTASGFTTLASHFPDKTVVTYDPRGLGRSTRKDGRVDKVPTIRARDVHAVIEALGAGPVDMFASSGGAVTALALVAAYPKDVVASWPTNRPSFRCCLTRGRPSAPSRGCATPTTRGDQMPAWPPSWR